MSQDENYQKALYQVEKAFEDEATCLDLSDLGLKALPPEIGKLSNLTSLNMDRNFLNFLPTEIGKLTSLTELWIHENSIRSLPPEIGNLIKLRKLWLNKNQLTSLPAEIKKLNRLTKLWLDGNQLETLPQEILQLTSLKHLYLRGNQNLQIPPEILRKTNNPNAILSTYFDADRPIHEAKIIFVGQGSVGKTSLVKRVFENKYDSEENKTDGISIQTWKAHVGESQLQLNSWDFGGQEIMHATHQFFLTKRSLYVLVLDSRISQEENRLEYWLKIIQSFGGSAPIILVGNKIDQQLLDIDKTGLQKKYPKIKAILETSCADGRGIEDLRAKITTEIAQLPHINDELPQKWFNIKDTLTERDDNTLPYSDYLEICNQHDVEDETSQRTLIGFLHDLGIMLHFQDDLRLSELGVLNPQWVTNGVYKILNSHTLFQNKGILQLKDLSEILPADEYPRNRHPFIIDMMEKFELCFRFDGKAGRYLIPDLLPKSEPDTGDWAGSLLFQFHYPVLPSSIISRFIVRMNPFISKNTVWRSGVILNLENSRTLIKADTEDRRIYISIQNGNPRLALAKIRGQLDSIHKTISGLEASEKVPVPGHPEIPPLDYEHLLTLEILGEESLVPEGMSARVIVKELLDGIEASRPRREVFAPREVEPEIEKPVQISPPSTTNPWKSGSFYIVTIFLGIIGYLFAKSMGWSGADILIAFGVGFSTMIIVGVLQLKNDAQLSDETFGNLIVEFFKRFPFFRE